MRFTLCLVLFSTLVLILSFTNTNAQPITLTEIAGNLSRPIAITNAGDNSGRLFITQQDGQILIYDGTQVLGTPFLDINTLVSCCGERGLLSVAFHPNYENNGFFYVFYTATGTGALTIDRFSISGNPNVADPNSRVPIKSIPHPNFANHNGGQLAFGPDGMLYASTGDGGSGGDPDDNGQNINVLLGKILRFNINIASPYIPSNNPFVGTAGADEIWAYGLRNPWRFSFDRVTGDLFIGDVGQGCFEEVNQQLAGSSGGENYGWDEIEGSKCYDEVGGGSNCNLPPTCNFSNKVMPILDYAHADNPAYQAVTGGFVYRGLQSPSLAGKYIYADYGSGHIWAAEKVGGNWTIQELDNTPYLISSFGEDEAGEIYFSHNNDIDGKVFRISAAPQLPYMDDFSDGDASDWTIGKGNWTVVNENLQGDTTKKAEIISPFSGCGICTVDADVQVVTAGGRVSVLGWHQGKRDLIELLVLEEQNKIVLKQKSDQRTVAKEKAFVTVDPGVDYHVKIAFDGSVFTVFWDGGMTPVITMNSQAPSIGTVGFRVKSTTRTSVTGSFREIAVN
ncbi:MAG TPA: PQQ-dependent sugar dehydrogenase [Acidobacteriota bacterium]|nr:PQQ-dependent sugar dehydrogenase [Acidobacteriota bacterium]